MLVSVTERTKEIGIRMSLGARQLDVMRQFLFEAITLSMIGGITGLVIAELLGFVITAFVFQTRIPIWAIFVAFGVSAVVGVGAGLYPAWKAARLDPIEALRAD
jgi:putative ABC transport system permease protein